MKHIILIGFMGCGKTTLGNELARALEWAFVDTDELVVQEAGRSVNDIFAEEGEAGFRQRESRALESLTRQGRPCVISAGGGLPIQPQNHRLLEQLGTVIYLQAPAQTLEQRLRGDTKRPLLQGADLGHRIRSMMEEREPIYQEVADLIVQTEGKDFGELIGEIKKRAEILDLQ